MIPGIPSAKCIRGPKYTSGGSRQLRYFSTLTHSLSTLKLARELRYEWGSSLLVTLCLSCVVCRWMRGSEGVFIGWEEEWRPLNAPCQRSMCLFTLALGSNYHKMNGGDGVELCFLACLPILSKPPSSGPNPSWIPMQPMLVRRWELTNQSLGQTVPVGGHHPSGPANPWLGPNWPIFSG